MTPKGLKSFREFWPYYVMEHEVPANRYVHVFGTGLGMIILFSGLYHGIWWSVLPGLICGYGFAWVGHFVIQKNRPATFTYPLWSLLGDFKMFFMSLTFQMVSEIERSRQLTRK